jgi:hypothetical protein
MISGDIGGRQERSVAGCERGYLCTVCGKEVEEITDSDLYLRYVLGEVEWDVLHRAPERHIACNPVVAQFIVSECFPPVRAQGAFSKDHLDPEFVRSEELRITRGFLRLRELEQAGLPIGEYPLAEARSCGVDDRPGGEP